MEKEREFKIRTNKQGYIDFLISIMNKAGCTEEDIVNIQNMANKELEEGIYDII